MIVTFADDETRKIFHAQVSIKLPQDIKRAARRKLLYLNDAHDLRDLRVPPGNMLEVLKGNRKGQHSIRINDQWRVVFTWRSGLDSESKEENATRKGGDAYDVEIVDYH